MSPKRALPMKRCRSFFTGSFASSKLTVINLTRIKLAVNNIFTEKRSPSKNNRLPAQPTCPRRATDRPIFSKVVHAACPKDPPIARHKKTIAEQTDCNKKQDWRQLQRISKNKRRARRRQIKGWGYNESLLNAAQQQAKHARA